MPAEARRNAEDGSRRIGDVSISDAQLIIASREDPRAFRELYDRWAEPLLAYFYRRTFDAEVAAELLAETFAVAFERRRRFKDLGRPGATWLYGIASKELSHFFRRQQVELRALRRLKVELPALEDDSLARIEALAEIDTHRHSLATALASMPAGERDAVSLRVVGELDYPAIASELRCSEAAARTRVHRGLARLSSLMEATQ
jgi:RNA polymerase sigma-70 factor (ECF subfamily)